MKAKKSFRWTNLEGWNALKEYFGLDIYLRVNFDKQKNLFIINKIKIERWLNSFIWMWKVKTFKVFRCQLFKIFLYNCKSLSSIHFNILKLLHFQSHTYIWKSWDQIFEFSRLKYCFKYISILLTSIILSCSLLVFFDDSSALIYEDEDQRRQYSQFYDNKKKYPSVI